VITTLPATWGGRRHKAHAGATAALALQNKQLLNVVAGSVHQYGARADGLAGATLSRPLLPISRCAARAAIRYGPRFTEVLLGDFALIADTLPHADVTTLDRVVCCCYPDSETLLVEQRPGLANCWRSRILATLVRTWN